MVFMVICYLKNIIPLAIPRSPYSRLVESFNFNGNSVKVARFRKTQKLDILERYEFVRGCLIKSAYKVLDTLEVVISMVVRVGGDIARRDFRFIDRDTMREAVLNAITVYMYVVLVYVGGGRGKHSPTRLVAIRLLDSCSPSGPQAGAGQCGATPSKLL